MSKRPTTKKVKAYLAMQNGELGHKDAYGATKYHIASTKRAAYRYSIYIRPKTKVIPVIITFPTP